AVNRSARQPGRTPRRLDRLRHCSELFALEYLANGYNATAAYKATHPRCRSAKAATVEGHRTLVNPRVQQFIQREIEARKQRLRMDADEALEGITRIARGDIRRLFDDQGNVLPINLWPENVADCVKGLQPTPFGWKLVLYDKLRAFELMAIAGGKLKQRHEHKREFDHAALLGAEPPVDDE
ncbi:MAG: terminase small subunit, partial [Fimbriimonadaceae bacterium]